MTSEGHLGHKIRAGLGVVEHHSILVYQLYVTLWCCISGHNSMWVFIKVYQFDELGENMFLCQKAECKHSE